MATPFPADGLTREVARASTASSLDDDVVIELNPIGQLFGTGPLVPIVSQYDPHPITKDMRGHHDAVPADPLGRGGQERPRRAYGDQPLAKTSAQSWGETDKSVCSRGRGQAGPGREEGPLAGRRRGHGGRESKPDAKAEGAEPKKPVKARIVVVGTADFASNQFLGAQGNQDFFLNVVSWLAEEEDQISMRPKDTKQNPSS